MPNIDYDLENCPHCSAALAQDGSCCDTCEWVAPGLTKQQIETGACLACGTLAGEAHGAFLQSGRLAYADSENVYPCPFSVPA